MSETPRGLTAEQLDLLLRPLHPNRVQQHKGQAHLEAWDVRRWLTRIFGFGGWSDQILDCTLVHESVWPVTDNKGEPVPGKNRATVVYRVTLRLTIKDPQGNVINTWEDGATGEAVNQASVGDAHDLALKAALSQALKRCAVNLGDQFGLSLYNDGGVEPVIVRTLGHPEAARPAEDVPEDAPVVGGELAEQEPAEKAEEAGNASRPAAQVSAPVAEKVRTKGPQQPDEQPQPSFWDTDEGKKLLKLLHTLIAVKYGPKTDEERHAGFSRFTGRQVTSAKQLTRDEAEGFITALRGVPDFKKSAATRSTPGAAQAADGNENFRQAEELLKLEQGRPREETDLEFELREEIEGSGSRGDLAAVMSLAMAARDKGTLTGEQYARLAAAADAHAARASKQYAGSAVAA